jgi:glutamate-5-semialdehyde dehydrogenase
MQSLELLLRDLGHNARHAARVLRAASLAQRNRALTGAAAALATHRDAILAANAQDVADSIAAARDDAFIDRLRLTPKAIDSMMAALHQIVTLPDPVGVIDGMTMQPSGIQVGHMRVPLGVIGMIYESRPNVTIDAAALCVKSGNAVILRSGSEALRSSQALARCMEAGLTEAGLPLACAQVVPSADREAVAHMLGMVGIIDVIIPRGGKNLTARVAAQARVPVINHLDGNCHIYVDASADADMAVRVVDNAKTRRFGVCGAMESLLIHATRTDVLLAIARVFAAKQVAMRCCSTSLDALQNAGLPATAATDADWSTEYLAPIVSIRMVASVDEAIAHIETYGSHHTDAIITDTLGHAQRFLRDVDSASVMVNASTQFADGGEYGLGAEIGISTNKLHVRGPVGLVGLTTQKWIVLGAGSIRA